MKINFQYKFSKHANFYVLWYWLNKVRGGVLFYFLLVFILCVIIRLVVDVFNLNFEKGSIVFFYGSLYGLIGILILDIFDFVKELKNIYVMKPIMKKSNKETLSADDDKISYTINGQLYLFYWKDYLGYFGFQDQILLIGKNQSIPFFRLSKKELSENFEEYKNLVFNNLSKTTFKI